jgi:hypothetical protein
MRDHEALAYLVDSIQNLRVMEVYSGEGIVGWHGNIERQLDRMYTTYEAARNQHYTDKLAVFMKIWRGSPISGSINVEDIDKLLSGTEILAVDNWHLKNYFSNLRDQLRKLKASEEELPRGMGDEPPSANAGGMSSSSLGGETPSEFGPDADKLPTPDSEELPPTPESNSQLPTGPK